ncbi:hypothetical protein FVE85_6852 [Porphyridium purpureum]|uniref:Uncharacterized protein n=1 Tax=Porphyridium purpureum TaxID=35688 RepID=A0A5J4Z9D9_PORPP|nr:hypothetical protein FVE85_6852 [Porphyridium purpureum]|eukprot:POR7826..scf295_1
MYDRALSPADSATIWVISGIFFCGMVGTLVMNLPPDVARHLRHTAGRRLAELGETGTELSAYATHAVSTAGVAIESLRDRAGPVFAALRQFAMSAPSMFHTEPSAAKWVVLVWIVGYAITAPLVLLAVWLLSRLISGQYFSLHGTPYKAVANPQQPFVWSSFVEVEQEGVRYMEEGRIYTREKKARVSALSQMDDIFRYILYCATVGAINLEPIVDETQRHQWMETPDNPSAHGAAREQQQGTW